MELIDEQGNTDCNFREIDLGHNIRRETKQSHKRQRERIRQIVANFDFYRRNNNLLRYVKALAAHITL